MKEIQDLPANQDAFVEIDQLSEHGNSSERLVSETEKAGVSIEPYHFYGGNFSRAADPSMADLFKRTLSLVEVAKNTTLGSASTAVLYDDYSLNLKPKRAITQIREAADDAGLKVDYIAREGACVPLAKGVLELLRRKDVLTEIGASSSLMTQVAARLDELEGGRIRFEAELSFENAINVWACACLASIWRALRLGRLKDPAFSKPQLITDELPNWRNWDDVPALIQLRPDAAPFVAREAYSILPVRFHIVETVVTLIHRALPDSSGKDEFDASSYYTFLGSNPYPDSYSPQ